MKTQLHEGQSMKATASRSSTASFVHTIDIRQHQLVADEPRKHGGNDEGPTPQELLAASLASCTAVTIEMYARHKGWDLGSVEVKAEFTPAERGCPTKFKLSLRLPSGLSEEQIERLRAISAKCPVHRALDGEVMFEERIEIAGPVATHGEPPRDPGRHRLHLTRAARAAS